MHSNNPIILHITASEHLVVLLGHNRRSSYAKGVVDEGVGLGRCGHYLVDQGQNQQKARSSPDPDRLTQVFGPNQPVSTRNMAEALSCLTSQR